MEQIPVGPVGRFQGEPTTASILGRRLRIWQDEDGSWKALEMVCRHQNADLSGGERDGDIVTCPRHGWRYDLSSGRCLTEGWAGLRRYEVREEAGVVYVSTRPIQEVPDHGS